MKKSDYVKGKYGNPILINADDFGLDHNTNLAIIELLKSNRIQRTTLLVNMPATLEAYEMAKENNLLNHVGLHINMTDGVPLTQDIHRTRFVQNGVFAVRQVEIGTRLHITKKEAEAAKLEIQAQFDRFKELFGYYPQHVDSHRHFHNYFGFLFIIKDIARKCGVKSMRIGINLYDHTEASFAKKTYKFMLNTFIRHYFKSTDYIGAWLEYINYYTDGTNKSVEIMVHPTYKDGNIYDIIYGENDEKRFYDFAKIR